jgi:hypothetical protein
MAFDIDPGTIPTLPIKDTYNQAIAYRTAGYPSNMTGYGLVADYAASNAVTAHVAADEIISAGAIWA